MNGRSPPSLWLLLMMAFVGAGVALAFSWSVIPTLWHAASAADEPSDWLGFFGNVLSAAVAGGAAFAAWRGIRYQTRIAVVSREEERIEKELAKLLDEQRLLNALVISFGRRITPNAVQRVLHHLQLQNVSGRDMKELEAKIPLSERSRLVTIAGMIGQMAMTAHLGREAEKECADTMQRIVDRRADGHGVADLELQLNGEREERDLINDDLRVQADEFIALKEVIEQRVSELADWQRQCRSEIDAFFARGRATHR